MNAAATNLQGPGGGAGLRAPGTATAGGTVEVEVGTNDPTVEVRTAGSTESESFDVPADKTVSIPVPNLPSGTVLAVSVGKGLRQRIVLIEIVP